MKVLLCEDIRKLGWLGDVVDVAEGSARNSLLPQGKATVATEGNIRAIAKAKSARAEERLKEQKQLTAAAEAVWASRGQGSTAIRGMGPKNVRFSRSPRRIHRHLGNSHGRARPDRARDAAEVERTAVTLAGCQVAEVGQASAA